MAETPKRVFAFSMAILFLATTVIGGLLVLWQIYQDNQQQNNEQTASEQSTEVSEEELQVQDENSLAGTELEGFEPVGEVNELQKIDLSDGDGEEVKDGATVTAHYTGALAKNGVIFESSKDSGQPATFPLSGVIEGWTEGVPGMKVGGKRRLIIPAEKAYGESGSPPTIGPNEPLVFDIELTDVQNP